jgi:hypothetical protein
VIAPALVLDALKQQFLSHKSQTEGQEEMHEEVELL